MENEIEIEYNNASIVKRFFSKFVDLFTIVFTCFVFFSLVNMFVLKNVDGYSNLIKTQDNLKVESGLYLENGTYVIDYVDSTDFSNYEEKKNYLSSSILSFYNNSTFFEDDSIKNQYYQRCLNKKDSSSNQMFYLEDNLIKEFNLNPKDYYEFYKSEIEDYSKGYLFNNVSYANCTRLISVSQIISAYICLFISYIIYKVILPISCFKRGRQTLGMKLFNISYIGVDAFNISLIRYLLKALFDFVIFYIVDVVSFLIPLFVSIGMMFLTKTNQYLSEYVFNIYVVDSKNEDVYSCYLEYLDGQEQKKQASLENKEFKLK